MIRKDLRKDLRWSKKSIKHLQWNNKHTDQSPALGLTGRSFSGVVWIRAFAALASRISRISRPASDRPKVAPWQGVDFSWFQEHPQWQGRSTDFEDSKSQVPPWQELGEAAHIQPGWCKWRRPSLLWRGQGTRFWDILGWSGRKLTLASTISAICFSNSNHNESCV